MNPTKRSERLEDFIIRYIDMFAAAAESGYASDGPGVVLLDAGSLVGGDEFREQPAFGLRYIRADNITLCASGKHGDTTGVVLANLEEHKLLVFSADNIGLASVRITDDLREALGDEGFEKAMAAVESEVAGRIA